MPHKIPVIDTRTSTKAAATMEDKEEDRILMPRKTLALLNRFLARYADLGADNMGGSADFAPSSSASKAQDNKMVHEATCDLCDKQIVGTRHKCMQCQDWDCCSACNVIAAKLHPGHDLLCIDRAGILPEKLHAEPVHTGVYCDACDMVICGVRYKCITCPDFDLCRNCEAHPLRPHKHHLFLKLDRPIFVTKSVLAQSKAAAIDAASQTVRPEPATNEATVVDEALASEKDDGLQGSTDTLNSKLTISSHTFPQAQTSSRRATVESSDEFEDSEEAGLSATVVRDVSFPDFSTVLAGSCFDKIWLVKNTGTHPWPAHVELRLVSQMGGKLFDDARASSGVVCQLDGSKMSVGGEMLVRVSNIRAPLTAGRARCFFKLAAGSGRSSTLFGDQLWTDLQIVQHDSPSDKDEISGSSVLLAPSVPIADTPTDTGSERSSAAGGHARRLAEWKTLHGYVQRTPSYAESLATISNPPTSATTESNFDEGSQLAWDSESHLSLSDHDDDDFEHVDAQE